MIPILSEQNIIQTGKIRNTNCRNCKQKDSLEYRVYGGVIRILFIPTLPNRRITKVFCTACQNEFNLKEFNDTVLQTIRYEKSKKSVKLPLWQFSGMIILISILSFGIYTGIQMNKLEKVYIQHPKKDDIYKVNLNGQYSTLKINNITKDSIFVLLNKFTLNTYKGLNEINIDKNYTTLKSFSRKEILTMYNENTIYEIIRE
jgi:hypothetical protein